jgi:hypothetical protein
VRDLAFAAFVLLVGACSVATVSTAVKSASSTIAHVSR